MRAPIRAVNTIPEFFRLIDTCWPGFLHNRTAILKMYCSLANSVCILVVCLFDAIVRVKGNAQGSQPYILRISQGIGTALGSRQSSKI